jgi:acylphosphatase
LTGHVKNARDGSVVGEAQGSEDDLKRLVGHLNKGPPAATVEKVEQKEISTKIGETGFGVH